MAKKTIKLELFGPEANLEKVQNVLKKYDGVYRQIYPRVKYPDFEPEKVHFEVIYEMKESHLKKAQENKKLVRYCTGMTTLDD